MTARKDLIAGFNSLQTGKWILTLGRYTTYSGFGVWFQFPSNGKVDPNPIAKPANPCCKLSFNSLQTGKWILTRKFFGWVGVNVNRFNSLQTGKWILTNWRGCRWRTRFGFNSLQTGKWILTETGVIMQHESLLGFNSLQTGKWILTDESIIVSQSFTFVSIPFKRESGS